MAGKKNFMHLPLPLKANGKAYFRRQNIPPQTQTKQNQQNRQIHGSNLKRSAAGLSQFWITRRNERNQQRLPSIEGGVPFLLMIDPTTNVDFLYGLGFEVVCELDDGFVVVASENVDLEIFQQKTNDFISNKGRSGSPAKVYGLCEDDDRLSKILSKSLYEKWATLGDKEYCIDLSIECNGLTRSPDLPSKKDGENDVSYDDRCKRAIHEYYEKIDDIARIRQQEFENIVTAYNPHQGFEYIDSVDSFSVRIKIHGDGLRDLVQNYGYIFEVVESTEIKMESAEGAVTQGNLMPSIFEPVEDSPIVCVIDSGIQENHKYLSPAVLQDESVCFIKGETSTNDEYGRDGRTGGHGTRVAGAILYPEGVPVHGDYILPCYIRNVRVLDSQNDLPMETNPCQIISDVVQRFAIDAARKSKVFNHSIGERVPFDGEEFKHMSTWAEKIDDVSYENDVLFIQASGNISQSVIRGLISIGYNYPVYFYEKPARLSNPAQSLQALTVGSISHSNYHEGNITSMGKVGEISSFSRIGPGIWDSIKPDVVEYGGTYAINTTDNSLTTPEEVCTDLVRCSPQGPAHAKDIVGTSFSAPKVAHIASAIQQVLPNAPALLYRALVVQSARLPKDTSRLSIGEKQMLLRQMGYGVPDVKKATVNNDYRVTLVTPEINYISAGEAHIYQVFLPDSLRDIGTDYNILVEITLSYSAKPKRTRRYVKGYMSTWVDWVCSRVGETEDIFRQRVFATDLSIQDDGSFKWAIREQDNWGDFKEFNRNKQTLQKDWCIIKSSQLNAAFCIAVRGHKGWGSLFKAKYALAVSFEAVDQNIEIYEPIRLRNQIEVEVDDSEVRVEI